jgi:hypothetical protein
MKSFFVLLCLLPLFAAAQEQEYAIPVYEFAEKTETYVFADTAKIRLQPSLEAGVQDTLFTGDAITILRPTNELTNGSGKLARWYEVRYTKEGYTRQGFIWGGLLSLKAMRRGAVKFVYGINSISEDSVKAGQEVYVQTLAKVGVKAVKEGKVIAREKYAIGGESLQFTEAGIVNAAGLKNVECIVRTFFSGAACGVPSPAQYYLWNGTQFIALPSIYDVADAGVFYHEEKYIFPSDKGGQPGKILFKEVTEETDEDKPDAKPKLKKSSKVYRWDGKRLVKAG